MDESLSGGEYVPISRIICLMCEEWNSKSRNFCVICGNELSHQDIQKVGHHYKKTHWFSKFIRFVTVLLLMLLFTIPFFPNVDLGMSKQEYYGSLMFLVGMVGIIRSVITSLFRYFTNKIKRKSLKSLTYTSILLIILGFIVATQDFNVSFLNTSKEVSEVNYEELKTQAELMKGKKVEVSGKVVMLFSDGKHILIEMELEGQHVLIYEGDQTDQILIGDRVKISGEVYGYRSYQMSAGEKRTVPSINSLKIIKK